MENGASHEVFAVLVEPGDLKEIDYVVNVIFRQLKRHDGAGEVGMAMVIKLRVGQERVDCLFPIGANDQR